MLFLPFRDVPVSRPSTKRAQWLKELLFLFLSLCLLLGQNVPDRSSIILMAVIAVSAVECLGLVPNLFYCNSLYYLHYHKLMGIKSKWFVRIWHFMLFFSAGFFSLAFSLGLHVKVLIMSHYVKINCFGVMWPPRFMLLNKIKITRMLKELASFWMQFSKEFLLLHNPTESHNFPFFRKRALQYLKPKKRMREKTYLIEFKWNYRLGKQI